MQEYLELEGGATFRAMAGLGGGVAGQGEVCGALLAAVAGLGLALGTEHPQEERNPLLKELGERLFRDFKGEWSSVLCREVRPLAQERLGAQKGIKECSLVVGYSAREAAKSLASVKPKR